MNDGNKRLILHFPSASECTNNGCRIFNNANERDLMQKNLFTRWINTTLGYSQPDDSSQLEESGVSLLISASPITNPFIQSSVEEDVLDNLWTRKRQYYVRNLFEDLRDGSVLLKLLETLTGKHLLDKSLGRSRIHSLVNVNKAFKVMQQQGIHIENMGPDDIVDGNPKLTLGLVWTIIVRLQLADVFYQDFISTDLQQVKETLLLWAQLKTANYPEVSIIDFTSSWRDGLAFCALLHRHCPWSVNYAGAVKCQYTWARLQLAFYEGQRLFGIPNLVGDAAFLPAYWWSDERCVLTLVIAWYRSLNSHLRQLHRSGRLGKVIDWVLAGDRELQECLQGVVRWLKWVEQESIDMLVDRKRRVDELIETFDDEEVEGSTLEEIKVQFDKLTDWRNSVKLKQYEEKIELEEKIQRMKNEWSDRLPNLLTRAFEQGCSTTELNNTWVRLTQTENDLVMAMNAKQGLVRQVKFTASKFDRKLNALSTWLERNEQDLMLTQCSDQLKFTPFISTSLCNNEDVFLSDFVNNESNISAFIQQLSYLDTSLVKNDIWLLEVDTSCTNRLDSLFKLLEKLQALTRQVGFKSGEFESVKSRISNLLSGLKLRQEVLGRIRNWLTSLIHLQQSLYKLSTKLKTINPSGYDRMQLALLESANKRVDDWLQSRVEERERELYTPRVTLMKLLEQRRSEILLHAFKKVADVRSLTQTIRQTHQIVSECQDFVEEIRGYSKWIKNLHHPPRQLQLYPTNDIVLDSNLCLLFNINKRNHVCVNRIHEIGSSVGFVYSQEEEQCRLTQNALAVKRNRLYQHLFSHSDSIMMQYAIPSINRISTGRGILRIIEAMETSSIDQCKGTLFRNDLSLLSICSRVNLILDQMIKSSDHVERVGVNPLEHIQGEEIMRQGSNTCGKSAAAASITVIIECWNELAKLTFTLFDALGLFAGFAGNLDLIASCSDIIRQLKGQIEGSDKIKFSVVQDVHIKVTKDDQIDGSSGDEEESVGNQSQYFVKFTQNGRYDACTKLDEQSISCYLRELTRTRNHLVSLPNDLDILVDTIKGLQQEADGSIQFDLFEDDLTNDDELISEPAELLIASSAEEAIQELANGIIGDVMKKSIEITEARRESGVEGGSEFSKNQSDVEGAVTPSRSISLMPRESVCPEIDDEEDSSNKTNSCGSVDTRHDVIQKSPSFSVNQCVVERSERILDSTCRLMLECAEDLKVKVNGVLLIYDYWCAMLDMLLNAFRVKSYAMVLCDWIRTQLKKLNELDPDLAEILVDVQDQAAIASKTKHHIDAIRDDFSCKLRRASSKFDAVKGQIMHHGYRLLFKMEDRHNKIIEKFKQTSRMDVADDPQDPSDTTLLEVLFGMLQIDIKSSSLGRDPSDLQSDVCLRVKQLWNQLIWSLNARNEKLEMVNHLMDFFDLLRRSNVMLDAKINQLLSTDGIEGDDIDSHVKLLRRLTGWEEDMEELGRLTNLVELDYGKLIKELKANAPERRDLYLASDEKKLIDRASELKARLFDKWDKLQLFLEERQDKLMLSVELKKFLQGLDDNQVWLHDMQAKVVADMIDLPVLTEATSSTGPHAGVNRKMAEQSEFKAEIELKRTEFAQLIEYGRCIGGGGGNKLEQSTLADRLDRLEQGWGELVELWLYRQNLVQDGLDLQMFQNEVGKFTSHLKTLKQRLIKQNLLNQKELSIERLEKLLDSNQTIVQDLKSAETVLNALRASCAELVASNNRSSIKAERMFDDAVESYHSLVNEALTNNNVIEEAILFRGRTSELDGTEEWLEQKAEQLGQLPDSNRASFDQGQNTGSSIANNYSQLRLIKSELDSNQIRVNGIFDTTRDAVHCLTMTTRSDELNDKLQRIEHLWLDVNKKTNEKIDSIIELHRAILFHDGCSSLERWLAKFEQKFLAWATCHDKVDEAIDTKEIVSVIVDDQFWTSFDDNQAELGFLPLKRDGEAYSREQPYEEDGDDEQQTNVPTTTDDKFLQPAFTNLTEINMHFRVGEGLTKELKEKWTLVKELEEHAEQLEGGSAREFDDSESVLRFMTKFDPLKAKFMQLTGQLNDVCTQLRVQKFYHELLRNLEDQCVWIQEKLPSVQRQDIGRSLTTLLQLKRRHSLLKDECDYQIESCQELIKQAACLIEICKTTSFQKTLDQQTPTSSLIIYLINQQTRQSRINQLTYQLIESIRLASFKLTNLCHSIALAGVNRQVLLNHGETYFSHLNEFSELSFTLDELESSVMCHQGGGSSSSDIGATKMELRKHADVEQRLKGSVMLRVQTFIKHSDSLLIDTEAEYQEVLTSRGGSGDQSELHSTSKRSGKCSSVKSRLTTLGQRVKLLSDMRRTIDGHYTGLRGMCVEKRQRLEEILTINIVYNELVDLEMILNQRMLQASRSYVGSSYEEFQFIFKAFIKLTQSISGQSNFLPYCLLPRQDPGTNFRQWLHQIQVRSLTCQPAASPINSRLVNVLNTCRTLIRMRHSDAPFIAQWYDRLVELWCETNEVMMTRLGELILVRRQYAFKHACKETIENIQEKLLQLPELTEMSLQEINRIWNRQNMLEIDLTILDSKVKAVKQMADSLLVSYAGDTRQALINSKHELDELLAVARRRLRDNRARLERCGVFVDWTSKTNELLNWIDRSNQELEGSDQCGSAIVADDGDCESRPEQFVGSALQKLKALIDVQMSNIIHKKDEIKSRFADFTTSLIEGRQFIQECKTAPGIRPAARPSLVVTEPDQLTSKAIIDHINMRRKGTPAMTMVQKIAPRVERAHRAQPGVLFLPLAPNFECLEATHKSCSDDDEEEENAEEAKSGECDSQADVDEFDIKHRSTGSLDRPLQGRDDEANGELTQVTGQRKTSSEESGQLCTTRLIRLVKDKMQELVVKWCQLEQLWQSIYAGCQLKMDTLTFLIEAERAESWLSCHESEVLYPGSELTLETIDILLKRHEFFKEALCLQQRRFLKLEEPTKLELERDEASVALHSSRQHQLEGEQDHLIVHDASQLLYEYELIWSDVSSQNGSL